MTQPRSVRVSLDSKPQLLDAHSDGPLTESISRMANARTGSRAGSGMGGSRATRCSMKPPC